MTGFPESQSTGAATTWVNIRKRFTHPSAVRRLCHAKIRIR